MNSNSMKWAEHIARVGTAGGMYTEPYLKTLKEIDHLKFYT
jgi:hypothetical protein